LETKQSLSTPLKMGLIIGLVYCIFIFIQNQFFYANPIQFAVIKTLCYLIIIGAYFYTGYIAKKELGGYITFQECLKSMLVAIAITELIYVAFGIIYIKFIDPSFLDKMKVAYLAFFQNAKMSPDQITQQMDKFNEAGKITFWSIIQSYGFSIIIDAVFAVIIAAILKKPRPIFDNQL